jgi:ribosomal protein S18 acetylase RimI-like enzyme
VALQHQPTQVGFRHARIVAGRAAKVNQTDRLHRGILVTIDVRPARPEELAETGRITAAAYREFVPPDDPAGWEDYLVRISDVEARAGRTTILVAVEDGRLLGSATVELSDRTELDAEPLPPDEAHVRMLGVDPSARGRGVGTLLMRECLRLATVAGKTVLTLNTTSRMAAAQRMYGSLGFTRRPDEVFPDGFVLLSYAKRLDEEDSRTVGER